MPFGRLEAQVTVPTGGWTGTIDDSDAAGAVGWTVAAGTYFLSGASGLLRALQDALNAAAPTDGFLVEIDNGEGGTGKVSITSTGAGTLVWTSTDLRDLLGYTGTLTLVASTANTASNQSKALWMCDGAYQAPNTISPFTGFPEADVRYVESASGYVYALSGQKKEVAWLKWDGVRRARATKANESTTNESFQRFVEEGVWGFASWGAPSGPIRFFPDADALAYVQYAVSALDEYKPGQLVDGWAGGSWVVELPRLVVQSSGEIAAQQEPLHALNLVRASSQYASIADASIAETSLHLVAASSQYASRAYTALLDGDDAFTFRGWVRFTTVPTGGARCKIAVNGQGVGTRAWFLSFISSGGNALYFACYDSGDVERGLSRPWTPVANRWYHVAVRLNLALGGSNMSDVCDLFVDGVELTGAPTINSANADTVHSSSAQPFVLGAFSGGGEAMDGDLQNVEYHPSALSDAAVAARAFNTGGNAAWPLNGVYTDDSGNGLTLTPANAPTFSRGLDILGPFTWEAMVKLASMPPNPNVFGIVNKDDGTPPGRAYNSFISETGVFNAAAYDTAGNQTRRSFTLPSPQTGRWIHLAARFDPEQSGSARMRLFVDRVQVVATDISTNAASVSDGAAPLLIGHFTPNPGYFDGQIDDVRIWSEARTDEQIASELPPANNDPRLEIRLELDTDASDSTGKNPDLTLVNGPTFT